MTERAIHIHTNEHVRHHSPFAVLVFAVLDQSVLLVRHPIRGWEPPGGKVEAKEPPEQAARREVWEESGATLGALRWMAEYAIPQNGGEPLYKWVFAAPVVDVHARPADSETIDVGVMNPLSTPAELVSRRDVSFILKDEMYPTLLPLLKSYIEEIKGAVR